MRTTAAANTAARAAATDRHERNAPSGRLGTYEPERLTRLVDESAAARLAVRRVLRHRARKHVVDGGGEPGRRSLARGGSSSRCAYTTATSEAPVNGQRAGERLEEEAAERVDVGTSVHLVAADLLGRDVVDGAHQLAVGRAAVGGALGEPEVREVRVLAAALLVEQDVGRLHVAVDEPLRVRRVERVRDLRGDREGPLRGERALRASSALRSVPSTYRIAMNSRPSASPAS